MAEIGCSNLFKYVDSTTQNEMLGIVVIVEQSKTNVVQTVDVIKSLHDVMGFIEG